MYHSASDNFFQAFLYIAVMPSDVSFQKINYILTLKQMNTFPAKQNFYCFWSKKWVHSIFNTNTSTTSMSL